MRHVEFPLGSVSEAFRSLIGWSLAILLTAGLAMFIGMRFAGAGFNAHWTLIVGLLNAENGWILLPVMLIAVLTTAVAWCFPFVLEGESRRRRTNSIVSVALVWTIAGYLAVQCVPQLIH
jgi:hypothetical protein